MTQLEKLLANTDFDHSRKVAQISRIIALKAGYTVDEADVIEQSALLHDVGKTSIPSEILNKTGKLNPDEYEIIKTHTENGYKQIMDVVRVLLVSAAVAKEHHERLDGSGYLKLPGPEINPFARLISIADVFDALISRRAYKESWNLTSVIQYLIDHGNQFDHAIVKCLVASINEIMLIYQENPSDAELGV